MGREVNWEELFANYNSVVDFPGSLYYKQILEKYPDAKVILTVRDPDSWYDSILSTVYSFKPNLGAKLKLLLTAPFDSRSKNLLRVVKMIKFTLWNQLFQNNFENKSHTIEIFNKHIEDTIKHVPAENLLVFQVKDGWEPLCTFLNKPIPNEPFPRLNLKEDFKSMTKEFVS